MLQHLAADHRFEALIGERQQSSIRGDVRPLFRRYVQVERLKPPRQVEAAALVLTAAAEIQNPASFRQQRALSLQKLVNVEPAQAVAEVTDVWQPRPTCRSEERRVGKEGV